MDLLTHVFLPLTVGLVLRPALFEHPAALAIGGLGLLSDFDKFLGVPGLLHSLLLLVPICAGMLLAEWVTRDRLSIAPVASAFVLSHPLLDIVDGGPAPLLYPLSETGIGLRYPPQIVFGSGPVGVRVDGPLLEVRQAVPRPGHNAYGFLTGDGVAWLLVFVVLYVAFRRGWAGSWVGDTGR